MFNSFRSSWKDKAAAAAAARDKGIPDGWRLPASDPLPIDSTILLASSGILTKAELVIIDQGAAQLATAIRLGKLTSEQVTIAYCKAAAIALQATNCLVELFVDEALARARELDAHFARTGEVVGPLHGVPVSIKDHIDVKGHDSPSGFLALVGKMVAKEDAYCVKVLRDVGAVFYCKTMLPQSIMHLETKNYLGTTVCPRNRNLTAGGSSGGEGALLGMRGSPLGVGTDIGGSVRSPAAAGGVFSFKPTVGRISYLGIEEPADPEGCDVILGTHGPMARHEDDLELYMRVMVDSQPWLVDPSCHRMPWRPQGLLLRPIRIGVLRDDGVVRPVSPIARAIEHVVRALRRSPAFEVVEYEPFKSKESWETVSKLYWAGDGGAGVYAKCAASGEPVLPLTQWIIDQAGFRRRPPPHAELLRLVTARDDFRLAFARHWQDSNIDVLLTPVGPTPAPKLGMAKYWNYTSYWNLVNYPAAVFPTGLHVESSDVNDDNKDNNITNHGWRNDTEREIWASYDPEVSLGAPLCLQLVGYIGFDEEVLGALKYLMVAVRAAGVTTGSDPAFPRAGAQTHTGTDDGHSVADQYKDEDEDEDWVVV